MRTLEKEEGRLAPGRRRKHHRLDRFLLQYYIRQFGTKALARKKLRQFVSSIRYTGIQPSEQILVLPFQEPCPELADTDMCASLFSSSFQSALLTFGLATMAAPCEIPQEFPARLLQYVGFHPSADRSNLVQRYTPGPLSLTYFLRSTEGLSHPRVTLFAKLSGIPVSDDDGRPFRPFALTDYFLPIVRTLVSELHRLPSWQTQFLSLAGHCVDRAKSKESCCLFRPCPSSVRARRQGVTQHIVSPDIDSVHYGHLET